ncbi:hypothetical protein BS47DRAFT_270920 [Hydnum rufescens UP504]|uniref:Uncharacterized protein n=1 Tax=Hydnum rufescens UP504 TaxID=1448309 RepID=A0A9P6DQY0_9AGAM|nr:hypothetical protein BS47DRAFT_270920 [Hydnum rufescens UP504]
MPLLVLAQQIQSAPGILLNPVPSRRYSYAAPNSATNNSDCTASSASSTSDGSSNRGELDYGLGAQGAVRGRRIRFAPLPDPRKLDAADNDSFTSLSEGGASETTGNSSTAASLVPPPVDISLVTGAEVSRSSLYKKATSMSTRLLKPLLLKQSSPNAEDGSPYASLFRVSSLESAMSAFSFRRRDKSPDSTGSTPSLMTFGGPVSSSSSLPITGRRSTTSRPQTAPNSNTLPRSRRFPGPLTMLNGRVYGRHRGALTPDPFQHQRPDHEDEFVEWGFGGLGSVPHSRATGAAADWHRVRGGTGFTSVPDEDDDGSGMRWVKRRREQKAREAAEAAEKAATAPHASDDTEKNGPPQPIAEGGENDQDDHNEKQLVVSDDAPSSAPPPIPPRIEATSSPPPSSMVPSHDSPPVPRRLSSEHHDTAVTVLPPLHHHRPNPSRTTSLDSPFQPPASNLLSRKPSIEKASDTQSSTSDEPEDEGENTEDEDEEDDSDEEVRDPPPLIPDP